MRFSAVEHPYNRSVNETTGALALLLAVLCVAAFSTRLVAVLASLAAFAVFNYFFLTPVGTFSIAHPDDAMALFALLAVSLIGSHLSQRAKRSAQQAILAAEQRQVADDARRSAEMKSAMVASFSHDLKTPLTALTVAAGNIGAEHLSDHERREQIAIVQTELERLKRLFDNLMAMASVETHAIDADLEWVHPADIIDAARQPIRSVLIPHSVVVTSDEPAQVVNLDPRLTSAALTHVLENAAIYSPAGSLISIDVHCDASGLRIAVRDRGPGLPAAELERVFDRFYRGSASAGNHFSSGMGLAIARGLISMQGGRITAENHPEGGAVFTVAVPAATKAAAGLSQDVA